MNSDLDMRGSTPQLKSPGCGHSSLFLCAECNRPKGTLGRRLRFVRKAGMRTYVCASCDASMPKKVSAA